MKSFFLDFHDFKKKKKRKPLNMTTNKRIRILVNIATR